MAAPKVVHVTSRDNPLLVRLRKLARHPGDYRRSGQVLLEGEHLCQAWVERGRERATHALVAASAWQQRGAAAEVARHAETVVVVLDALLAEASSLDSAATIAFVVPTPAMPAIDAHAPTVVMDRLQDAGNAGSMLRSASAFGFTQVIAIKGTAALWAPKTIRAAMGAHLGLSLIEGADAAALDGLEVPLIATSPHARERIDSISLPWPCGWLFGNEGAGASAELTKRCRIAVRIAQPNGEESLNVAVAAGICLHESSRRRG